MKLVPFSSRLHLSRTWKRFCPEAQWFHPAQFLRSEEEEDRMCDFRRNYGSLGAAMLAGIRTPPGTHSCEPFTTRAKEKYCMLSFFSLGGELASYIAGLFPMIHSLNVSINASHVEAVKMAVMDQQAAVAEARLLKLPFTTIYEYLQMLRLIATAMKDVGPCSMFYLAAAVSDFYVPWKSMVEHKIESGSGPLDIRLAQVPKMLSVLRTSWASKAFCISFKLETDSKILIEKATKALQKYRVHAVVANELSTRKEEVVVVSSSGNVVVRCDTEKPESIVEDNLIRLIVDRHSTYIKEFST
ncbi:hypothetical protein Bca4012_024835 [Brassica carinata]